MNVNVHELLRQRLHERAGITEPGPRHHLAMQSLERTEWNPEFERLMRNRLAMGALRYGRLGARNKPAYDRLGGALKRLRQYRSTGNTECLVDVANMMLLEFCEGSHPKRHFGAMEGDHCCV